MLKLFHITFLNLFLIFLAIIFLLVFFTSVVKAENSPANIEWQKSLGGSENDEVSSIQQTSDGGYIIVGGSYSNDGEVTGNHGKNDYWIVKLDSQRTLQWQKSLGGSEYDGASSIQQTSDGGYIIAGESSSNDGDVTGNHGKYDYWIVKLDSLGTLQWQKIFGGRLSEYASSIQRTSDGGYIIAGYSDSNDGDVTGNHGKDDYWIVKLDSLGNLQWQKSLGGSKFDYAYSSQQTSDGGFIIAGESGSNDGDVTGNHGETDYWIVKLDSLGTLQWQKSLGGSGHDMAYSIQQISDGGYIIAGISDSNDGDVTGNHGSYDYWIVKLDSLGSLQWQKSFGGSGWDHVSSIQQTSDGGYIIAGHSRSNDSDVTGNHGKDDYWIVKLDSLGTLQWQKSCGGSEYDYARSIQQTSDGGYIIAGYSESNDGDVTVNHGKKDYWIIKLQQQENVQR
ncbi:MAG: T9SS C-terminal target domain-containing protein [Deltaproteobacteria bacterium]|jgi:hypothetical protein|nr:T9SS C-terminal target domain-containing protein [Deltaproteobacteria bacterium]